MEVKNYRVVYEADQVFVSVNDVKVAKRGIPGTPEANAWVSLERGWIVRDIQGIMARSRSTTTASEFCKFSLISHAAH